MGSQIQELIFFFGVSLLVLPRKKCIKLVYKKYLYVLCMYSYFCSSSIVCSVKKSNSVTHCYIHFTNTHKRRKYLFLPFFTKTGA